MNTDMFKQELNVIGGGCFGGGVCDRTDTHGKEYGRGLATGAGSVNRGYQGRGDRYDSSTTYLGYNFGARGDGDACYSGTWDGTSGYHS